MPTTVIAPPEPFPSCARCGYSRNGLDIASDCPECGTPSPMMTRAVAGGERKPFSWQIVLVVGAIGTPAPILASSLWSGTAGSPSLGLMTVGYLLGFLIALRRWRIESPTTWHLDEDSLRIERVRGSQRIRWHEVRDCVTKRAPDGTLHLWLIGQRAATAFCTLRCDATAETASAVRAVILHRSACAIAVRASALRKGAEAAYDDFAVAAHRLGAGGERLVIAHVRDGTSIPLGNGTQLRTRRFWTWLVIDVIDKAGEPLGSVLCFGTPATTRTLAARIAATSTSSA